MKGNKSIKLKEKALIAWQQHQQIEILLRNIFNNKN